MMYEYILVGLLTFREPEDVAPIATIIVPMHSEQQCKDSIEEAKVMVPERISELVYAQYKCEKLYQHL